MEVRSIFWQLVQYRGRHPPEGDVSEAQVPQLVIRVASFVVVCVNCNKSCKYSSSRAANQNANSKKNIESAKRSYTKTMEVLSAKLNEEFEPLETTIETTRNEFEHDSDLALAQMRMEDLRSYFLKQVNVDVEGDICSSQKEPVFNIN